MQKRYAEKFKARMISRLVGPNRISAKQLSREVGVGQPTLSLWLRQAGGKVSDVKNEKRDREASQRRPEDWTPHEKLKAVMEAAALDDVDLGSWLRRKGIKEEHLRHWQETLIERAADVFAPKEPRVNAESRKRLKDLERELQRKDKALAETAALLVLQGKMQALWAEEDDSTEQNNDAPSSSTSQKRKRPGRR